MEKHDATEKVKARFVELHGVKPRLFRAPGRVNLIGEHTDYNQGFVMPFAIDRQTVVAVAPRDDSLIKVEAMDIPGSATIDLAAAAQKQRGDWIDYVEGTARSIEPKQQGGADLVFASSVPIGAGLSSSAALEVAIGFALLSIRSVKIDRRLLAFAAQKAEHEFVGTRSGIMDQFAAVFGREGNAMLLDCRSLEIEYVPLELEGSAIVVCDTKVKHRLASSEYNNRRKECERAVELLRKEMPEITSLRDVSLADLERFAKLLPPPLYARAKHVVSENLRTVSAARLLTDGKLGEVGALMFESHESLRKDYEVSSPELDALVEAARGVEGVYGARMTGGGFGGCTVNLLQSDVIDAFSGVVSEKYNAQFGRTPDIYRFGAADGASEIFDI